MEQANQQIIQKLVLPIKTKIATWWLIILGILPIIIGLGFAKDAILYEPPPEMLSEIRDPLTFAIAIVQHALYPSRESLISGAIFFLVVGLTILLLNIFVLKRKKIAWWALIILLLIGTIPSGTIFVYNLLQGAHYYDSFVLFLALFFVGLFLPLILLILDRKNFFKIAS